MAGRSGKFKSYPSLRHAHLQGRSANIWYTYLPQQDDIASPFSNLQLTASTTVMARRLKVDSGGDASQPTARGMNDCSGFLGLCREARDRFGRNNSAVFPHGAERPGQRPPWEL